MWRWHGFTSRMKRALPLIVAAAAPLQALWLIYRFGVDVPRWDDWSYVSLSWETPPFHRLWAQHNEHRVLVGKLLIMLLERATRCDVRAGMYATWVLLLALFLLLSMHRRGPALALVPLAWIVFDIRQYENLLWGSQCTMTLSAVLSAAAFYFLDGRRPRLAAAMLCAAGASLSFANGLLVWPVGLLQVLAARRTRTAIVAWTLAAVILAAAYLHAWVRPPHHPPTTLFTAPSVALGYFVTWLGASLSSEITLAAGTGAVLLCLFGFALMRGLRAPAIDRERLLPAALIAFTLASAALLAVGRGGFGVGQALQPRYVVFSLLGLAGLWISISETGSRGFAAGATLALVMAGSIAGRMEAFSSGTIDEARRIRWQQALLSYRIQPDDALRPLFPDAARVRELAPGMESRRLGPFRNAIDDAAASTPAAERAEITLDAPRLVIPLAGDLEVSGAARFGDRAASGVLLRVDSRLSVPAAYGLRSRGRRERFFAALPAVVLGSGHHSIEVRAITPDGRGYSAPLPPLDIEVR
jgi:hypothetical protein